jgi:hypothetical protein
MKNKDFIKNSNGVAGVIEALLLIGLVAIILSFIQLYYVPEMMESLESDHMDQVSNQFSSLKSVIEIQSTMGVINSDNPNPKSAAYTSISSPITLGNNPLPYFVTIGSTGSINLKDKDDAGNYRINIQPSPVEFPSGIPLTSLEYTSYNNYYLNGADLLYILEGGGIILKQPDGESMRVYPAINVVNYTTEIEMNWEIILFKGTPGKKIYNNGFSNPSEICYIRSNYTKHYEDTLYLTPSNSGFIHIYTDYTNAWKESLIQNDIGLLFEYFDNNYIDLVVDESTKPNRLIITPGIKNILLKITIVEIGIQVGPGIKIDTS